MHLLGKTVLEGIFRKAVAAVEPGLLVRRAIRLSSSGLFLSAGGASSGPGWSGPGKIYLAGGGKAGRAMGDAVLEILGDRIAAGVLAVPPGRGGEAGSLRFVEAGHPLPDGGGRRAAAEMMALLSGAGERDLVIALISGGGSAMLSAPAQGVSPDDKEVVLRQLLRSGADIAEFNTVRKHLSLLKGGRMAKVAHPARVWALLLSDVPGDDPSVIASGPFSPDPTTYLDAINILLRRNLLGKIPHAVRGHIEAGVAGKVPETPKPGDPVFGYVIETLIGSNLVALEAVKAAAEREGAAIARVLPGFLRGEARECARAFVSELRKTAATLPSGQVAVLAAGGETTVTVVGRGKGGRNQEFALAAAIELDGEAGIEVLSAGTDGIDGPTGAAGAYIRGDTCSRASGLGVSPVEHLSGNDSYPFFLSLSDLVVTGPTGTNVTDIAIGAVVGTRQSG